MVFKEHNENAGGQNTPMRAVQTKDWLYIFSPWSNGTRVMGGATAGTPTCRQMRVLAQTDPAVAARVDLFDHRVPEEAYEVRYDPDALTNLIDTPANAKQVAELEQAMEAWMARTNDPLLEVFRHRQDAAFREEYMRKLEASQLSKAGRKKANAAKKRGKAMPGAEAHLIELQTPETVTAGQKATVRIRHTFPEDLGERPVQVTLKDAKGGRIKRNSLTVKGSGEVDVTFDIPDEVPGQKVVFAGLVGTGMQDALQHVQSNPIPLMK